MSDFEAIQGVVTRLEWIDLALKGTNENPGLLDQLERLLAKGSSDAEPGLVEHIGEMIRTAEQVVASAAAVQGALAAPIDQEMQRSIEQSIREAVNSGAESLDERAQTLQRVGDRASEQMAQSVAQAELVSRSTQDLVSNTRAELDRVTGQISGQLEGMLKEVADMLSPEAIREPLQNAAKKAIQEASVEADVDGLRELHRAELRKVSEEIKQDFRQYQEGFQDELVETQREASERIRKIIAGRGPSQAIIELYDQLDALGGENESLKKQIKGKGGESAGPSKSTAAFPKHLAAAIYAALIASGLSLWGVSGGGFPW